jgi:hypothetical protein
LAVTFTQAAAPARIDGSHFYGCEEPDSEKKICAFMTARPEQRCNTGAGSTIAVWAQA